MPAGPHRRCVLLPQRGSRVPPRTRRHGTDADARRMLALRSAKSRHNEDAHWRSPGDAAVEGQARTFAVRLRQEGILGELGLVPERE